MIKNIIILIVVFIIILWIQNIDDKKNKYNRNTFDKYKLPLLVCAFFGFFLNMNMITYSNNLIPFIPKENNIVELCVSDHSHLIMHTELPDF